MPDSSPTALARRAARGAVAVVTGSSPRTQAAVLLVLALPQFFLLPRGSIDIALSTFVTVLILPGVLLRMVRRRARAFARLDLFGVLIALLAVRLLALTFSPDPRAGLQSTVLLGQFIVTLLVMAAALREEPALLRRFQALYWPWVALQAFLVVLFRLLPAVEDAFLHSVAGFFLGHNTIAALFGDNPNNVLDPAKSGGLFVNANVAAMFLGVNGLFALAVHAATRARWALRIGVVALATVPFTGSKSAILLVVTLPAAALIVVQLTRSAMPHARRYRWVAALSAVAVAILLALAVSPGLRGAAVEALVGRAAIWGFGAESFRESPVLGLGYGGWDAGFPAYAAEHGIYRSFPPHNILLAAWSTTGIAGLALTVAFFALALRVVARQLLARAPVDRRFAAFAGAAIAWILVQSMGENTDVYGEIHLIPVVALLCGYLTGHLHEEAEGNAAAAHGGHPEAPAVPAIGDVHPESGSGPAHLPAAVHREGPGTDRAGSRLG